MNPSIELFTIKRTDVRVYMNLGFEGEDLKFDGHDLGTTVDEHWGSSEYEYTATVLAKDLEPLYALLGIVPGEKEALLEALAPLFSTNSGYTQFKAYMKKHGIAFDTFTY
jgi:hypothetical protein